MARTGNPLRVYTIDDLPEEVVAVTFAKTSRVPDSFDVIARELSEAESSSFHEKWVIGYGHASVSEHAVLSIAIENISILGAKLIEENRLSSFTEKSTRYQVMDPDNYYTPGVYREGRSSRIYREAILRLYSAHAELMPVARRFCERKYAGDSWEKKGVSPHSTACDMLRGLVPCAAKTNVGWTVNARSLRHALVKMASQPLEEMRELGEELTRACKRRLPTLLRYTEKSAYLAGWEQRVGGALPEAPALPECGEITPGVRLVSYDPEGEDDVLASVLFRASGCSYDDATRALCGMGAAAKAALLETALEGVGAHEAPVREFENTHYTFEIIVDYGAYRDIQRHRMTTQTQQVLTCDLGYAVPTDAQEAGVAGRLGDTLDMARESWVELSATGREHAQYAVPLAFHKRFLMTMDFREAYYFVRLRSGPQGHESYRRVALGVKREIERVHPTLGSLIPAQTAMEPVSAGP